MYTIEEYDKEKSKVLKYILYKKRTKQEIKNKFYGKIEAEMFSEILEELEEKGYIDDKNYIERAINEYRALNNLSLKEVRYKLLNKGIKSDLIEDYISLNEEEMEEYEINSAKIIMIKKQNILNEEELMTYLLKKGYKSSNIKKAIELLDE